MTIGEIIQILVQGTLAGGSYSLIAVGLTLIYGVARVINLAHGAFYLLGAFACYGFISMILGLGLNPWYALLTTLIFVGILGAILYRSTIHPILGDEVAQLVVTITLAVLIADFVVVIFGSSWVNLRFPFEDFYFIFLGILLSFSSVTNFSLSISLFVVVAIFVNKSKIGKAMRALSQDREAAMLMGINTSRLLMFVMTLSTILAAIAGFMAGISSPQGLIIYYMWFNPMTTAFAIVVLGGLGSIKGSFIASFIIAYAEQAIIVLVPQGGTIVPVAPLTAMIIVLLVRPKGLFGKRVEMED
jgi:branched-chain amino acid transport system permease protein